MSCFNDAILEMKKGNDYISKKLDLTTCFRLEISGGRE